ncbi:MAG: cytochrome c [Thermoanaerobaculia bacterium]
MARPLRYLLLAVSVLLLAVAVLLFRFSRHGLSVHDDPTQAEELLARVLRNLAAPADLREAKNPVRATPEILVEARGHFADHCAVCHGNDGRGNTTLGQRLYPRAPDMTLEATQSLSDGEMFAVIENGIRLTGMPGWGDGTAESARGSWGLVHFIRNLSKLSEEDLREMEKMNPMTAEQFEQMKEEEAFLQGEPESSQTKPRTRPSTHSH